MVDGLIQKKMLMTALGTALLVASIATIVFAKYLHALSRQMQTPMPSPTPNFPSDPRQLSVDDANRIIERSTHPFSTANIASTSATKQQVAECCEQKEVLCFRFFANVNIILLS